MKRAPILPKNPLYVASSLQYDEMAVQSFTLNTQNADAWRGLLISGKRPPSLRDCSNVTLGGALELLATGVALRESSDLLKTIANPADAKSPMWRSLMSEWERKNAPGLSGDVHGIRPFEFFRLRTAEDKTSLNFSLFLERFCRSMKQQEFPKTFANALAKIGDEMADNVVQHSGLSVDGFTGMAGYHVQDKRAAFAVIDIGRGILATLKESPRWSHLITAGAALRAVVTQGASSRKDQGEGEGFKQLFGSLVDHNVIIRLRTDDSSLTVADGLTDREGGEMMSPFLAGVQVSVVCAVGAPAKETQISA